MQFSYLSSNENKEDDVMHLISNCAISKRKSRAKEEKRKEDENFNIFSWTAERKDLDGQYDG